MLKNKRALGLFALLVVSVFFMGAKITDNILKLGATGANWLQVNTTSTKLEFSNDSGTTFTELPSTKTPGYINNLGIKLTAGVLSIVDASPSGAALSATNPGYVTMNSATAGALITLKVTVGGFFNDDNNASSSLTNIGFGITEGVNWAQDVPYFLFLANLSDSAVDGADGHSAFFLSRNPALNVTPASTLIGDQNTAPSTDSQNSIIILDDVTVASYAAKPCQLVAALRMRWATGTTDWTVQTIGNTDGFGSTQLNKTFGTLWTFPTNQNGAASGTHFLANGGTAPTFTTASYFYTIDRDGYVTVTFKSDADGGTDGAGAVNAIMAIPYAQVGSYDTEIIGSALTKSAGLGYRSAEVSLVNAGESKISFFPSSDYSTNILNSNFSNGDRFVNGTVRYKAY